jgi:hypothetical protein
MSLASSAQRQRVAAAVIVAIRQHTAARAGTKAASAEVAQVAACDAMCEEGEARYAAAA